jgi:hypothetical protein
MNVGQAILPGLEMMGCALKMALFWSAAIPLPLFNRPPELFMSVAKGLQPAQSGRTNSKSAMQSLCYKKPLPGLHE